MFDKFRAWLYGKIIVWYLNLRWKNWWKSKKETQEEKKWDDNLDEE